MFKTVAAIIFTNQTKVKLLKKRKDQNAGNIMMPTEYNWLSY